MCNDVNYISEVTIINQSSLSNIQFLSTVVHVVAQSSDSLLFHQSPGPEEVGH